MGKESWEGSYSQINIALSFFKRFVHILLFFPLDSVIHITFCRSSSFKEHAGVLQTSDDTLLLFDLCKRD